jgi:hypothetical protein
VALSPWVGVVAYGPAPDLGVDMDRYRTHGLCTNSDCIVEALSECPDCHGWYCAYCQTNADHYTRGLAAGRQLWV